MKKLFVVLLFLIGCQSPVSDSNREQVEVMYEIISPKSFTTSTLTPDASFNLEIWYNKKIKVVKDLSLPHADTLMVNEQSLGTIKVLPSDSLSANVKVYVGDSLVTDNYLDRFPRESTHHFWVSDY